VTIQIGPNSELPGAGVPFHCVRQVHAADREEAAQMVKAAKMGMFDGLFADPHEPRR
jgi:hypothetical protein